MTGNISSTKMPRRFAGLRIGTLLLGFALLLALAGAAWTAKGLIDLSHRRIVTVRLSALMGEFVEAEARKGTDPEAARQHIAAYLGAVQKSVEAMGKNGTTVLVAEAVVSGSAKDVTEELRANVAHVMDGEAMSGEAMNGEAMNAGAARHER